MARVWKRREDGTAPEEAQVGDFVVTNGGTYKVGDKDFYHPQINTYNYNGKYANPDITPLPGDPNKPAIPTPLPGDPKKKATVSTLERNIGKSSPASDFDSSLSTLENELLNQPDLQAVQKPEQQNPTFLLDANSLLASYLNASGKRGARAYGGSEYDPKTRQLVAQVLGMNYDDWTRGDAYKALAARYADAGRVAADDTMAQIAARTGGLASSYASTAANQQYLEYMKTLEDAARKQFAADRADTIENAGLAQSMGNEAYQRWRDEQSRRDRADEFEVGLVQQIAENAARDDERNYNRAWNEDERTYNRGRDAESDKRYYDERDYNRAWNEDERNYNRAWNENERTYNRSWNENERAYTRSKADRQELAAKAEFLARYGNFSGYAELFGLSEQETKALIADYADKKKLDDRKAALEIGAFYAQYGDFSLLKEAGVDTSGAESLYGAKIAGTTGRGGTGGARYGTGRRRSSSSVDTGSDADEEESPHKNADGSYSGDSRTIVNSLANGEGAAKGKGSVSSSTGRQTTGGGRAIQDNSSVGTAKEKTKAEKEKPENEQTVHDLSGYSDGRLLSMVNSGEITLEEAHAASKTFTRVSKTQYNSIMKQVRGLLQNAVSQVDQDNAKMIVLQWLDEMNEAQAANAINVLNSFGVVI